MTDQRQGRIAAISISAERGTKKVNVDSAELKAGWGIDGDAHAGNWHRQISLLAVESIAAMQNKGLPVQPGDFAENIATEGLDLTGLRIGDRLNIGGCACEVTQIGKECHNHCAIYFAAGDCIMPRKGIFCRVHTGGRIKLGDSVTFVHSAPDSTG